jgi:hypothetical protein
MLSTFSSSSVRAQSSVSDTLGAFLRSSWRIAADNACDLIGEVLGLTSGTLARTICLLTLELRVVDVQVQAATLQRLGQLARVVRREEHEGDLRGGDRAELGDRHLVLGEDLEQQRLGLDLDPVHLVDQEDHRIGPSGDGLEQRTG